MKNTTLFISFILAFCLGGQVNGQTAYCLTGLNVSLNAFGEVTLYPSDIDAGSTGYETLSLTPDFFTCADIGANVVTLVATASNGDSDSCTATVNILDNVPPVAICDVDVTVQLDPSGEHIIDPFVLDDGSYDACSAVTLTAVPGSVSCGDPNPLPVQLVVMDDHGNSNTCLVLVHYDEPVGIPNLACNDAVTVEIINDEPVEINANMLLEGGPYACPGSYEVTLTLNGNELPEPVVGPEHVGKTLIATVTEPVSGNSCWGLLHVENGTCPSILFCDTECRDEPLGDCPSGHTDEDAVEWPCDIEIAATIDIFSDYPTPDYLQENGFADPEQAFPETYPGECHLIGMAYEDQVFIQPEGYLILRKWSVVEWVNFDIATYVQEIFISTFPLIICDTLPWTAPEGTCESGHSLDDAIEWPADDTVYSVFINPIQLALDADIHPYNVEPRLFNDSVPSSLTWVDELVILSDTSAIVTRTWTLINLITTDTWQFDQTLYIFADLTNGVACAFREDGEPVEDVIVKTGYNTDETGCADIEVTPGEVIAPTKSGDLQEGVDIIDAVLLMEHILGISQLSPYQMLAADISGNGVLSTLDVVLLNQIIDGTYDEGPVWRFFDASVPPIDPLGNPLPQEITVGPLPYSYQFVAVKTGDLDLSYVPEPEPSGVNLTVIELHMKDEILNLGESYHTFMYSTKTLTIQGLQLEIDASSQKLDISSITSSTLPGFDPATHVKTEGEKILVRYTVPLEYMQTGDMKVEPGEPILEFDFQALDNGIFSDEFSLLNDDAQYMKVSASAGKVIIILKWDDELASGTRDHTIQGIGMYPNPATERVHITSQTSELRTLDYAISDLAGRHLLSGNFVSESTGIIDVSTLQSGMYIIHLRDKVGRHITRKLFVQR